MKMSPLNKYYFDKSYIVDKHDPNHDKRNILHTLLVYFGHACVQCQGCKFGVNPRIDSRRFVSTRIHVDSR